MRPTVAEQLAGLRRTLLDAVAPAVDDAYASAVLADVAASLAVLAERGADVPAFLRWDIEATGRVLALVGVAVPPLPADLLDSEALHACHDRARALLADAVPALMREQDTTAALVQLFRDRISREPLTGRA